MTELLIDIWKTDNTLTEKISMYIPATVLALTASHCKINWNLNEILLEKKKGVTKIFSFDPRMGVASICCFAEVDQTYHYEDIDPILISITDKQQYKLKGLRNKHNVFFDMDRFNIECNNTTEEMLIHTKSLNAAIDRRNLFKDIFEEPRHTALTGNPFFSIEQLETINLNRYGICKKYAIDFCQFYKVNSNSLDKRYPLCIDYEPILVYSCDDPYIEYLSIRMYLTQNISSLVK